MPGGDSGDDFAEFAFNQGQNFFNNMITNANARKQSGKKNRLSKMGKAIKEAFAKQYEDREQVEEAVHELAGQSSAEKALSESPEKVKAYAIDLSQAERFAEQLDMAGVKFTMRPPQQSTAYLYEFAVKSEELALAGREFSEYYMAHSIEKVEEYIASRGEGVNFAYAVDESEAKYLAGILDGFGVEYNTLEACPLTGDLFEFSVSDEQMELAIANAKANGRDFGKVFDSFSLENAWAALGIEGAAAQCAPDVMEKVNALPAFEKGSNLNKRFGFKTTSWDRDASLMQNTLENAGIPFDMQLKGDEMAVFEVQAAFAPEVEKVADQMCKNIRGVDPSRFDFPEGFNELAPDISDEWSKKVMLDPEVAKIVCGEMQAQGIEYTASQMGADGQVEVVANITNVDSLKKAYASIESREVAVLTPEQAQAHQRSFEVTNAGNKAIENRKALEAQRNTTREASAKARRKTPSIDQREMSRSARARTHANQAPKRTSNATRGVL